MTDPRRFIHAIIPHPTESRILLLRDGSSWALPTFEYNDLRFNEVAVVNQFLHKSLGIKVTTLRCVSFQHGNEPDEYHFVFAMENQSPSWLPGDGAQWFGHEALNSLSLAKPEHRPVLETWFAEVASGEVPLQRPPWARPGWFAQAAAWMHDWARRAGFEPRGQVEQLRSWSITCMLRLPTTDGHLYLKAVPEMFGRELALTQALYQQYPAYVPEILAIDDTHRWLLMREFSGTMLHDVGNLTWWETMFGCYAGMQVELSADLARLFDLGCADRRLTVLASQVDGLIAAAPTLLPVGQHGLSAEQLATLQALAPQLKQMCMELEGYGVPFSLTHGDFHAHNVLKRDEGPLYFDWTDGCVAHPFFDFANLVDVEWNQENGAFAAIPDARQRLEGAYLQPWTRYDSPERLRAALKLAYPLGALHQAVSYQGILESIEPAARWELNDGLSEWLRILLNHMDKGFC